MMLYYNRVCYEKGNSDVILVQCPFNNIDLNKFLSKYNHMTHLKKKINIKGERHPNQNLACFCALFQNYQHCFEN